jgi:hypothetical protein
MVVRRVCFLPFDGKHFTSAADWCYEATKSVSNLEYNADGRIAGCCEHHGC